MPKRSENRDKQRTGKDVCPVQTSELRSQRNFLDGDDFIVLKRVNSLKHHAMYTFADFLENFVAIWNEFVHLSLFLTRHKRETLGTRGEKNKQKFAVTVPGCHDDVKHFVELRLTMTGLEV